MHRGLLVANILLFLFLSILTAVQGGPLGGPLLAAGRKVLPADGVRLELPAGGWLEEKGGFAVVFPASMAAGERAGGPLGEGPVRLEPPAAVSCRWSSPERLEVVPREPLPGARRYRVLLDPGLAALDGRRLPSRLELTLETPPLRLVAALPMDSSEDHRTRQVAVSFDLPVRVGELRRALTVQDLRGKPLLFTLEEEPGQADQVFLLTLPPGPDEDPPERIELVLDPALKPRHGDLPLGRKVVREVTFPSRLLVERIWLEPDGLCVSLSHVPSLPGREWFSLKPDLPVQVARNYRGFQLLGDFPPGEVVELTLKEGFPGAGSRRLAREHRVSLVAPDLPPSLEFASPGAILSSRARPVIQVEAVNVAACRVAARTLYPNNIVSLAHASRWCLPPHAFGPWRSLDVALAGPRNRAFHLGLDLKRILGDSLEGIHEIRLTPLGERGKAVGDEEGRLFQVTDLGVTLRAAPGTVAVRAASLATGAPAAGATVRILTPTNQELAAGATDDRGIAVLSCPRGAADKVPFVVEVRQGLDRTFLDLDEHGVELADDGLGGRPYLEDGYEAWVGLDRGILRPGETQHATLILRDREGRAPAAGEVEARWSGPDGRVRHRQRLSLGAGLLAAELPTTLSCPAGAWRLGVWQGENELGAAGFRVEAFVPERLEVRAAVAGPLHLGQGGSARIEARWLEGSPASRRPGRLRLDYAPLMLRPEGFEAFSFAPLETPIPPGAVPLASFLLDEKGVAEVPFALPEGKGWQALEIHLEVEVEDPAGRPSRAAAKAPVLRREGLLGVRALPEGAEVVVLDPLGRPLAEPCEVEVCQVRCWWDWGPEEVDGRIRYRSRRRCEVVERRVAATAGGPARVAFAPGKGEGWFVVVARRGGVEAAQAVAAVPPSPDRLRVTGPAEPVAPGGEARVAVECPFGGTLFWTLEGAGLHGAGTAPARPGHNELAVPVPTGLAQPNLHFVATLTRPQASAGATPPFWLAGGAPVSLQHGERTLKVGLELPERVEPGSEVVCRIAAPGATAATVALVDEGVLRVTAHPDSDPLAFFFGRRRLDSRGADTGTAIHTGAVFDPGATPGGDAPESKEGPGSNERLEGSVSDLIRPVVLFAGPVRLDAAGRAEVSFRLPEYEGRLRAVVVAAGDRALGAARAGLVVAGPLGLLAAAPRLLRPGDQGAVALTVRNGTGAMGRVALSLETFGGAVLLGGPPPDLPLAAGETATVLVSLRAGESGPEQGLVATARLGELAVLRRAAFAVRPLAQFSVERIGLAVAGEREFRLDGDWLPGGRVRLRLEAGATAGMLPALRTLLDYPYGCVEQVTSRLFALLACRPFLPRLAGEGIPPDAEPYLQAGIDRLLAMQAGRGGLAAWPGNREESLFGTVYGLAFLLCARAEGLAVPAGPLQALMSRAEELLREERGGPGLRCQVAESLALGGRPVASWLAALAGQAQEREDRLHLALAWAHLGRSEEAKALLAAGGKEGPRREQGGLLRSELRRQALELRARLVLEPGSDRVAELGAWLALQIEKPGRLTTQELGQALLALAALHRAAAPPAGDFRCTVITAAGGAAVLDRPGSLELAVEECAPLRLSSPHPVYALLEVRGARAGSAAAEGGCRLQRTRWDLESGAEAAVLRPGGIYEVRIEVEAPEMMENLCVTDLLPGGLEPEGGPRDAFLLLPAIGVAARSQGDGWQRRRPGHVEIRDDRVLFFLDGPLQGRFALSYRARATFPGEYLEPPATVEALYDPGRLTRAGGGGRVRVGR